MSMGRKLGDMVCPWHAPLTLRECWHLHEAVGTDEEKEQ
jgi:hypothetical protein